MNILWRKITRYSSIYNQILNFLPTPLTLSPLTLFVLFLKAKLEQTDSNLTQLEKNQTHQQEFQAQYETNFKMMPLVTNNFFYMNRIRINSLTLSYNNILASIILFHIMVNNIFFFGNGRYEKKNLNFQRPSQMRNNSASNRIVASRFSWLIMYISFCIISYNEVH